MGNKQDLVADVYFMREGPVVTMLGWQRRLRRHHEVADITCEVQADESGDQALYGRQPAFV